MRLPMGRNVSPWSRRLVIGAVLAVILLAPLWIDPVMLDSIRGARPSNAPQSRPPSSALASFPVASDAVQRSWSALARDSFERTVPTGWGNADLGGEWQSSAPGLSVGSGAGLTQSSTAELGSAFPAQSIAHDESVTFSISVPALPAAGEAIAGAVLRHTESVAYLAAVHVAGDGTVSVSVNVAQGTAIAPVDVPVFVPGLVVAPSEKLRVRAEALGIDPATVRVRVWAAAQPEPAYWQASVIDWTGVLQHDGGMGLGWMLSAATAAGQPFTIEFDDFEAASADEGEVE